MMPVPFSDGVMASFLLACWRRNAGRCRTLTDCRLFYVELARDQVLFVCMVRLVLRVHLLNTISGVFEIAFWTCCLGSLMLSGMTMLHYWDAPVAQPVFMVLNLATCGLQIAWRRWWFWKLLEGR